MSTITLTHLDAKDRLIANQTGSTRAYLARKRSLARGDQFIVGVDHVPAYIVVQLDAGLTPALLYVTDNIWHFQVPLNDQREWPYSVGTFTTRTGYATVRYATDNEIHTYRNLAVNSHDQHMTSSGYPHASANAETRGEYVFFARNAIDGILANESHGNYPFQSWGINEQADAEFTLDFGRPVTVDQLNLILRADYPHDSYWQQLDIDFSDGSTETVKTIKTATPQNFTFSPRTITQIKLTHLVKNPDSATFPALTELKVFGQDA